MEWSAVILLICCTVSLSQFSGTSRGKIDGGDDRWIWGYEDAVKRNVNYRSENRYESLKSTSTTVSSNPDSCIAYDPPKPNFKAPRRKISEEKCEEYKWVKTVNEEQRRRDDACYAAKVTSMPPFGIVGGRSTFSGEFPHMGAVGWKSINEGYVFKCAGSIISSKFILTAAHCSEVSSADTSLADVRPKIVRLNDKNLFQRNNIFYSSEDVNISRIIVHPGYEPPKKYFDIALLELQWEVIFSNLMQPACLWTRADVSKLRQKAIVTGWGVLHSGGYEMSPELQAAEIDFIDNNLCDQLLHSSRNRHWWELKEHQLCAGKLAGGVDACQGDSGGPLQVKQHVAGSVNESVYFVIGVTSFGIGCASPNLPGIYTRVSSFIDWIEAYVWPR